MIIDKIKKKLRYEINKYFDQKEDKVSSKIIQNQQQPIYHVHIRKTAGTTINFAFLTNANHQNVEKFYESIAKKSNCRIIKNDKVFVGWNVDLINKGDFSYAFSHTPFHQLNLQPNTFVFTCLRDPVKRVISHYNMLRYFQLNNINHPCMETEGKWLGNNFDEFIINLPKEHLLNQLFMFSKDFDTQEALERLKTLDSIIYTETLNDGLKHLELLIGWSLPISNQKKYGFKEALTSNQISKLKEKLNPEYELIEMIKKEHNKV
jgi:hypothetical protein